MAAPPPTMGTAGEQDTKPPDNKVTSLMKELFNACSNGTDKLDVNQFSVLLSKSLTNTDSVSLTRSGLQRSMKGA